MPHDLIMPNKPVLQICWLVLDTRQH